MWGIQLEGSLIEIKERDLDSEVFFIYYVTYAQVAQLVRALA